jgi:hypothetical protein
MQLKLLLRNPLNHEMQRSELKTLRHTTIQLTNKRNM